jgi:hypothetical protein
MLFRGFIKIHRGYAAFPVRAPGRRHSREECLATNGEA